MFVKHHVYLSISEECVDVRQRQCYMEWDEGDLTCGGAVGVPQTRYLCCCSVGRAWGAPCEACPDKGSQVHSKRSICIYMYMEHFQLDHKNTDSKT